VGNSRGARKLARTPHVNKKKKKKKNILLPRRSNYWHLDLFFQSLRCALRLSLEFGLVGTQIKRLTTLLFLNFEG
jgi:hypothetical protein